MKSKKYSIAVLMCITLLAMFLNGCGAPDTPEQDGVIPSEEVTSDADESIVASEEVLESESVVEEESLPEEEVVAEEETPEIVSDGGAQGYFTTTDINGNEVTQQIFANSDLTVFNVWATYCGPCINEMPSLGELSAEYDTASVQIIGLPMDATDSKTIEYAKSLIEQTGANYTHILYSTDMYDWGFDEIQYVPTTFFVDREGNVIDVVVGSKSKEDWKALIDEKLASL